MLSKLHLGVNPILVKELRSRMRDSRAFVTLTAVLLLLGSVSYLLYRIALAASQYNYSSMPISPQIGQALFIALAFLELMMVSAIAPAVTAGAISGEREKLTYEMLLATPLRPASILWGKLISALSYVFLLIFAAIPMASIIFIFGGVTPRDMIKALVILVVVAVTLGMLGLFMSAWLGRTARATVVSYLVVAALYALPVVAYVAVGILRQAEPPRWILLPSPLSALFSAVTPSSGGDWNFLWILGMGLGGNLRMLTGAGIDFTGIPRPLYHYSVPLYGLFTLILYYFSTHLILPTRRWKVGRKEIIIALLVLLLFAGGVAAAFWASADNYGPQSIFAVPTPMGFSDTVVVERQVAPAPGRAYPVPEEEPPRESLQDMNAAPYPAPEIGEPVLDDQEAARQGEIYAEVVRQLYLVDYIGEEENLPAPQYQLLYLIGTTDDAETRAVPESYTGQAQRIPGSVQRNVLEILNGDRAQKEGTALPAEIRWIPNGASKPMPAAELLDQEATVLLGNIHYPAEGTALVSAAIYNVQGGRRGTYTLEFSGGRWSIQPEN